jgi:hypothetical protein
MVSAHSARVFAETPRAVGKLPYPEPQPIARGERRDEFALPFALGFFACCLSLASPSISARRICVRATMALIQ